MTEHARFRDGQACLCVYAEEAVHVACPRCSRRAVVVPVDTAGPMTQWPRRLICTECTYSRDQVLTIPGPRSHITDQSFGAPLWLQRPCSGHVLWALNAAHLDVLERYIAADLRERGPVPGTLSMLESLPAWMKQASHRDEVLRGLQALRSMVAG